MNSKITPPAVARSLWRPWLTRACLVVQVLLALVLTVSVATPVAAQSAQITLLHISDTHSHLAAWGPKDPALDGTLGGLPKAAAIVAAEKAAVLLRR